MKNLLHTKTLKKAKQLTGLFSIKMPLLQLFVVVLLFSAVRTNAQTPVPMATQPSFTYTENFDSIATWTNSFAAGVGANRFASVAVNATGTIPSATRITTATTNFVTGTSGGVQKGTGNIQLLSTGATDNSSSAAFDLLLNFSGVNAGTISFNAATVFNSTGNRAGSLRVYATIDNTNWTEVTGTNLPYSAVNNVAGSASISNITLPSMFDNSATAKLRFYYHNSVGGTTGSRPKISIDNINIVAIDPVAFPTVTSNSATATVGVPFSYFITATSAPTSYNASGLPSNLSINTLTGEISGIVTNAVVNLPISIEASNNNGTGLGTLTLTVNPGSQTITFGALGTATYGDAPFAISATGGPSGNPVTFASSDPSVATVSGNMVTIVGGGTAIITASQAGNADYNAATDVNQTLIVNQASQTITFNPLPTKFTNSPPFALTATGGASGNPITYVSSNTAVATIAGNIVTITGAGTTIITASQAGNANYLPATDVSQSQLVNLPGLIAQTITFNALPPVMYGSNPITLNATGGGSGNPITYVSSNTNVAMISGNVMTIIAPGTTTITASQAGNAAYAAATPVNQSQLVNLAVLTVPAATADDKQYDGTNAATISNTTLNGVVGSDIVSVSGGGIFASVNVANNIAVTPNLILNGPDSAKYSFTQPSNLSANITQATQVITFGALAPKTYTSLPFALSATGGTSGNPITYVSDNPLVATVSGNIVTITGVGTANITASQAGDANHLAAVDVVQVLTVNQATQFINFTQPAAQVLGGAPFTLTASASSTLPLTFVSSNPAVATVAGNVVTIVGVGSTIITASQAGNTNFLPATDVLRTLTVTYPLIAAWDFFGQNTIATFAATTFSSNLVSTSNANKITRGPTAAASAGGNSFRTIGFQNNGIATTNTDYFQTTLQAQPGYSLSLYSINANFAGTASFAATPGVTSQYAYSLDGTNFTLIGSPFVTIGTPASSPLIDVTSIPALQNIHASQTLTIRYYASGQTTTGGWGYISSAAGVNGLAFGGQLTACVPVNNTTNVTVCSNTLPYTWNGQTYTASGTYTYSSFNTLGCDSIETLNLTVNSCAGTSLALTCFIEGYWDGASAMLPVLLNQGQANTSTECDSITVELYNAATLPATPPYTADYSTTCLLNTNGTTTATFSSSVTPANYYIVVKHRNALQTWSANALPFPATTSYNFSTAASQAYGGNQVEVATGIFAFHSGDVAIDENMDLLDLGLVEADISAFSFGYLPTDLNGDGNVDLLDGPVLESNISNFVFSAHP